MQLLPSLLNELSQSPAPAQRASPTPSDFTYRLCLHGMVTAVLAWCCQALWVLVVPVVMEVVVLW